MTGLHGLGACILGILAVLGSLAGPALAQQSASDAAKLVPADIRARGVLRVGSQQTFPPVEFREPGKTEVTGVSRDLLTEIGRRLDLKIEYIHAEYAALISGIEADRFDNRLWIVAHRAQCGDERSDRPDRQLRTWSSRGFTAGRL